MLKTVVLMVALTFGCVDGSGAITRIDAAHMVASAYCAPESGDARYACEAGVVKRTCGVGCDTCAVVPIGVLDRCLADMVPGSFPATCIALF